MRDRGLSPLLRPKPGPARCVPGEGAPSSAGRLKAEEEPREEDAGAGGQVGEGGWQPALGAWAGAGPTGIPRVGESVSS